MLEPGQGMGFSELAPVQVLGATHLPPGHMGRLWRAEGKGGSALTLGLEPEDLSGVPLRAPVGGERGRDPSALPGSKDGCPTPILAIVG